MPRSVSAPTKVVVFQWPCGTPTRSRVAARQRPWRRAMLVVAQVSSMKTSRSGSRSSWLSNQSCRRFRTSGRSCSLRVRGLFLRVMPWRAKKRWIVPKPKTRPCSVRLARTSSMVASRSGPSAVMTASRYASIRSERRSPPSALGADRPVRAPPLRQRLTLAALDPEPIRSLAMRRAGRHCRQNPNAKIDRQRF